MNSWFKCASIRAFKTFAQTMVSLIGVDLYFHDVEWSLVLSASVLAMLLSYLTSIPGLPEENVRERNPFEID